MECRHASMAGGGRTEPGPARLKYEKLREALGDEDDDATRAYLSALKEAAEREEAARAPLSARLGLAVGGLVNRLLGRAGA